MAQTINNFGLFIGTTRLFDLQHVAETVSGDDKERQLKIALYQAVNDIIKATNLKETGYYLQQEFVTGSNVFDPTNNFNKLRPVYRMVVNFGALPAAGTKSVAHTIPNVNSSFTFLKIFGAAFNPTTKIGIPIPFSSAAAVAANLALTVDATNVNITTGGTNYSAYTNTLVTLEYIKQ